MYVLLRLLHSHCCIETEALSRTGLIPALKQKLLYQAASCYAKMKPPRLQQVKMMLKEAQNIVASNDDTLTNALEGLIQSVSRDPRTSTEMDRTIASHANRVYEALQKKKTEKEDKEREEKDMEDHQRSGRTRKHGDSSSRSSGSGSGGE